MTRPAAVAGMFYPASPEALRRSVREFLDEAGADEAAPPKVLIVPHAGYVYSGSTAARGYATLRQVAGRVRHVVLVGPAHRVALRGVAIPSVGRFETPLGPLDLDRTALDALAEVPHVVQSDRAHAAEHALEVQLPFLQEVLENFTLVPLVVGDAAPDEVAAVLERVWGGPETLIVVSSDLSHYLPYDTARRVDAMTLAQVLQLGPELDHQQACGATPINALMLVARRRGLHPRLLTACNSGDTAGDRDGVVGYAALAFTAEEARDNAQNDERGEVLLAHARNAIESLFRRGNGKALRDAPFLDRPGATFVTLCRNGELRGCIGSLEAERPLREDVAANARAAALRDPRFEPLTERDLEGLSVEVSLLDAPQPLTFHDEDDLVRQLQAARDGVLLEYGRQRSTFLPQVWEQLPDPWDFLRHLKVKAGLSPDFWSLDIRVSRYAVEKWSER
ncbi:MAG TPA: AmmeMemoRadiSam system protein B [Burkholderiaceae bacterium]|nr:AmmeMemoRadiSam system protein B [Burkholderiaceae bacterium]